MKRASKGYSRENIPLFPTMIVQCPFIQGEGLTHPVESHHIPTSAPSTLQLPISLISRRTIRQEYVVPQPRSPTQTYAADEAASTGVDVRYGGDATIVIGLEARQGSGNIDKTPTMPQDSPFPRKVESLETDLKHTKLTYGATYTMLIKKVKKLENKVKSNQARRRARIGRQDHDMEFEFDLDAAKDVSTAEEDISTAKPVSTAGAAVTTASVDVSNATVSTAKDKALRLQAELKEEERQRIASVQEATSSSNIEEWEARVKADEELAQRLQAEEREKYSKAGITRLLAELINQRKRRVHTFIPMDGEIERAIHESTARSSKTDTEEELVQESSKRQKTRESSVSVEEPKDKEEELSQKRLQQMMIIVPEQGMNVEALQTKEDLVKLWDTNDELWKLQKYIHDLTWRLYDSCEVHHVSTEKGINIHMLIEKEYPLSRGTLTQMLVAKLLVEQDNEMSRELLKKIFMVRKGFSRAVTPLFPTMMVQAQEEMGEEPIADEVANEENVPTQSNDPPLLRVNTLRSVEDRLKLKELMDLCTKLSDRVLDLETTKATQAKEIASLKKRFKKLE
ncbi:hypothetical protein Tco_1123254 [Tanacetum coccineum]|uniref:Uncharacterized protein n=1 Tax=Tanacetum coccineum TaxID=301880 RepID=A0ABQ5J6K2_9ASTR